MGGLGSGDGSENLIEVIGEARDGPACLEAIALYKDHQRTWKCPVTAWDEQFGDRGAFNFLSPRFRYWLTHAGPRGLLAAGSCRVCDDRMVRLASFAQDAGLKPVYAKPLRGVALAKWAHEFYAVGPALAEYGPPDPEGVLAVLRSELGDEGAARACGLGPPQLEALLLAR